MSRPPRLEFSGAVYHVIARGNEQRDVFRDDSDRDLYLRGLARYQTRFRFRLYAYCLMTNHIHLALETGAEPLSRIVLALHSSYAQAFNKRHERVGDLFQGRYKAFLVQKTAYLLALIRYIHENPVKAGLVHRASDYPWSSDRFYRGKIAPDWLDPSGLLQLLGADPARAARRYRLFMESQQTDAYETFDPIANLVKGDESYARKVLEMLPDSELRRDWNIDQIARTAARRAGVGLEHLRGRALSRDRSRIRAIAAFIANRHCRIPLTRAAEFFRRDGTTLVRDVRRLEIELAARPECAKEIATILKDLELTGQA
jgi:REP element-mobilizing transposase RayT